MGLRDSVVMGGPHVENDSLDVARLVVRFIQ